MLHFTFQESESPRLLTPLHFCTLPLLVRDQWSFEATVVTPLRISPFALRSPTESGGTAFYFHSFICDAYFSFVSSIGGYTAFLQDALHEPVLPCSTTLHLTSPTVPLYVQICNNLLSSLHYALAFYNCVTFISPNV